MNTSNKTIAPMTIIPAGAGSGKTYTVQKRLGEWIEKGLIESNRIVAVTFTEAAASELRERIRSHLLSKGLLDDALKLDQSYISTIHGFGLDVLTEFSFEAGSSPQPRLLNEEEQSALIRQSLSQTSKAKEIIHNLTAYGYKYVYGGKSAEELFRDDILSVITLLRSMGWKHGDKGASIHAVDWVKNKYGGTLKANTLTDALHHQVIALLKAFPDSLENEYGSSNAAKTAFNKDFRSLKMACSLDALKQDWNLWGDLRNLRLSKKGNALPEEYDALAQLVIDAANQLPFHPGPLNHASNHIEALINAAQEVLSHYSESKLEAGLVDYTDMIAMTQNLLANNPKVLNTLAKRIDCLVVDEFQDTNPLQFSFLWLLKEAGIPTLIVGDLKQAIMGFQGADPRLFEELERQFPESRSPLTQNWRSQPKLMDIVNSIGPILFSDSYTTLTPKAESSELSPLEIIDFSKMARKDAHKIRAGHVGIRIKELLEAKDQFIKDSRTGNRRLLQGGDIAVLAHTENILLQYAEVFRACGLKVRLKEEGWGECREIQIALYALAYVANPADKHAALYLAVTELGQLSLQDALSQLISTGRINDPILSKLDQLSDLVAEGSLYTTVSDTLNQLGFYDIVSKWPDAQQARANLLRLQAEAAEYMNANREALANSGIYGNGIQSFLAWLRVKLEKNNKKPDSKVVDEDAIELVTWHSSKGREWPIVAVAALDRKINAKLPNLGLGYQSFEELTKLLTNTHIEYSPKFSATETNDKFLEEMLINADKEARRLLYVACTRARDKLILEWPSYLKNKNGTYLGLLLENDSMLLEKCSIKINEQMFSCEIIKGNDLMPSEIDLDAALEEKELPITGRRAIKIEAVSKNFTPDNISPSTLKEQSTSFDGILIKEKYAEKLQLKSDIPANVLGTAVHKLFEVLGSCPDLSEDMLCGLVPELEKSTIVEISEQVNKFESYIQSNFNPTKIHRELPFLSVNQSGTVVSGAVDLVIENNDGLVIIDHKTDQTDDIDISFANYLPQLQSYADELSKEMGKIDSIGIHWIRTGEITLFEVNQ